MSRRPLTKRLHLERAWLHVQKRAKSRWGLEIGYFEWRQMGDRILDRHERPDGVRFVERLGPFHFQFELAMEDLGWVPVVWNERLQAVVTVLDRPASG